MPIYIILLSYPRRAAFLPVPHRSQGPKPQRPHSSLKGPSAPLASFRGPALAGPLLGPRPPQNAALRVSTCPTAHWGNPAQSLGPWGKRRLLPPPLAWLPALSLQVLRGPGPSDRGFGCFSSRLEVREKQNNTRKAAPAWVSLAGRVGPRTGVQPGGVLCEDPKGHLGT